MNNVFICDSTRTAIGRYGGGLASVRTDDLAAAPMKALADRNPNMDWEQVDDVIFGCANQAGEDNRNVARMATLLSGLPHTIPATTVNRLCGSGLNAVSIAASTIKAGDADMIIAGGVESMSRAPFVMGKAEVAYDRSAKLYDTTMGWRFINAALDKIYGSDVMPQTAEYVAEEFGISREDQDQFALWSQNKAAAAIETGMLKEEITPVTIPQRKKDDILFAVDEHPRSTTLEKMASLKPLFEGGTVTAGNASGINDGAAAIILASESAVKKHNLIPKARILGSAVAGVLPRIMGTGPIPATQKLLKTLDLTMDDFDLFEFNEAFAAQALACTRTLGLEDNDPRINPLGGAIALGHPLGMSGTRLALTAAYQLGRTGQKRALCTMCIGVGQGISLAIERA